MCMLIVVMSFGAGACHRGHRTRACRAWVAPDLPCTKCWCVAVHPNQLPSQTFSITQHMAYLDGPERALKRAMAEQKPPAIVVVPDADANASWLLPTVQPMKKCTEQRVKLRSIYSSSDRIEWRVPGRRWLWRPWWACWPSWWCRVQLRRTCATWRASRRQGSNRRSAGWTRDVTRNPALWGR